MTTVPATQKNNNKDDGGTNADDDDGEQSKLTEFHAKNYFNSTMGGKHLRVLFAMAIGCNSMDLPDHKEPPFSRSKTYHSENQTRLRHSEARGDSTVEGLQDIL